MQQFGMNTLCAVTMHAQLAGTKQPSFDRQIADLDFGKDNIHINGAELLAKQLCISAKLAKLGTIQIFHRHSDSKAGKGCEDLAQ